MTLSRVTLLALLVPACGWDGLLLTPRGFEPTDPPRATLSGAAFADAAIAVMNAEGKVVAQGLADGAGRFELALPPEEAGSNLRVLAVAGGRSMKTVVATAPRGARTDLGQLDARSTAIAQLASYELLNDAGSSFTATPPPALRGLVAKMADAPTPRFEVLRAVVAGLVERGPAFELAGFALAAGVEDAEYRAALAAAAQDYGIEIRCDPTRIAAMFAVDVSGRARDGNGAPQLIRQPTKEVFFGFTLDESSPIDDPSIPRRLKPNDASYAMRDDGTGGDELAGDGVHTVVVALPRGARIQYKYTNGSAGEGFTGTEEWPGNARILEVGDVLTGRPDGAADCVLVRRDAFGDEATNKNFVNLNAVAKKRGGTVSFDADLGGADAVRGRDGVRVGGLERLALRMQAGLTPAGVPEARENGACAPCPAPLILDPEDSTPPRLLAAERLSVDRVRLRFSEPIRADDARDPTKFLYLDDAGRRVDLRGAEPSGSDILLATAPTHPTAPASLRLRDLADVSGNGNKLSEAFVQVGPDRTAPRVLALRPLSRLDLDPRAAVADPERGELLELSLDEALEESAAGDPARYRIDGLEVRAAIREGLRVRLITAPQEKRRAYVLRTVGLRDIAGNAVAQELPFEGFALYKVRFGVVPGFAFASSDGAVRGPARGEKLYLTGTPLLAARDLSGRSLSILERGGRRSDVTGWPQFELRASGQMHLGQPIHAIELLLPPGSWAWKAAHGVEGEQERAPPTLEKVYKTLATANDGTGVRVDPVTMRADNGVDYTGARLSESGEDPPRRSVVYKREAPDELCDVVNRDVECPFIVIGAWRDLVLDQGGRTRDYDDGILALPPHRPSLTDVFPPRLLDARARDSFSILLSFDEALGPATSLELGLADADRGVGLPIRVLAQTELEPHQAVAVIEGAGLSPAAAYAVRYRGAADRGGRKDDRWRTASVLAPDLVVPLTPLTDTAPPRVRRVEPTDLNELLVHFDERLDAASVGAMGFSIAHDGGAALAVEGAELAPDRRGVLLSTARQAISAPYRLTVRGIADLADPPNVLTATSVAFTGFGESVAPRVLRVAAIGPSALVALFDEPLDATSAMDPSRYAIDGLSVRQLAFSGDPALRARAFNARVAPRQREAVWIETSAMQAGARYVLSVRGVADLSGNAATASVAFSGVAAAPAVDVILEYEVSDTKRVAGRVPARAVSLAALSGAREGVFVLGARTGADDAPVAGGTGPVNDALGGFPPEGQPLDDIETRLRDDGNGADAAAGDGIFSVRVPAVPLGTTMIWKAFAPFTTEYRDRNPADTAAAFADALPGPSVYGDGQEYPGNENGAIILGEGATPGVVRIRCLFGDEVSYKKHTGGPAFVWVATDRR